MIVPHRGKGALVLVIGVLAALVVNVYSANFYGEDYYREKVWPKIASLWLAGLGCLGLGLYLRSRANLIDPPPDAGDPHSFNSNLGRRFPREPKDHLIYVPIDYWGIIFFVVGIIYAVSRMF